MINLILPSSTNILDNFELNTTISEYSKKSCSTGCNSSDYNLLYTNVKKNKFRTILECGTGVTTIAIAYALYENHKQDGIKGIVYSMEEDKKYYDFAIKLIPEFLKPYVKIIYSDVVYDYYSIFRGVRYKNVPKLKYDFCFIDGPVFNISKSKGRLTFDFDLLHILQMTNNPIYGFVDGRNINCWVFKQIFGDKFLYIPDYGILGVINGVTKKDLEKIGHGRFYGEKLGNKCEKEIC